MHKLFSVLQSYLVKVAKLALDKEEKLVMQEGCLVCKKKAAFAVLLISERNKALAVFVVYSFVNKKIFADNDNPARTAVTWDLDQHMC